MTAPGAMASRPRRLFAPCVAAVLTVAACGGAGAGAPEGPPPTDPVAEVGAQRLFDTGIAAAAQGDYVRAEQYLAAAGARGYEEAAVIGPLVRVCVAASRLRQALVYAQPYLRRHATDWRLRFVVAAVLLGLERVDDARAELERVIATAPEAPEPYFVLGALLRDRLRDDAAARPRFERYLALVPEGAHSDEARVALASPLPAQGPPQVTPQDPTLQPAPTPVALPAPAAQPVQAPAAQPVQAPAAQPVQAPAVRAAVPPAAPPGPVRLPARTRPTPPTETGTP